MSASTSIIDRYIEKQVTEVAASNKNLGHKMLCPKCRTFERHSITANDEVTKMLLTCKRCGTSDTFVLTRDGYMLAGFKKQLKKFTYERALEELLRGHK